MSDGEMDESPLGSRVKQAKLITFNGLEFDLPYLKHFIEHYLNLGLLPKNFVIVFHIENRNSLLLQKAEEIASAYGIEPALVWIGEYSSQEMTHIREQLIDHLTKSDDWIIHADADEFHFYPDTLENILKECEEKGANAIQGVFVDRISKDYKLNDVKDNPSIYEQFPIPCSLNKMWFFHDIFPYTPLVKMMAYKHGLKTTRGGHRILLPSRNPVKYALGFDLSEMPEILDVGFRAQIPYQVHHFKWCLNLISKLERRSLTYKRLNVAWKVFSTRIIRYFKRNNKIDQTVLELFKDKIQIFP